MFWHNFKYTLKVVLRDHALIFWTFAFPLILATFFFLAFSNITSSESLDIIDLAVVDNEAWKDNQIFRPALQELSNESSDDQQNTFPAPRPNSSSKAMRLLPTSFLKNPPRIPKALTRRKFPLFSPPRATSTPLSSSLSSNLSPNKPRSSRPSFKKTLPPLKISPRPRRPTSSTSPAPTSTMS